MLTRLIVHWKTTFAGAFFAAAQVFMNGTNWKQLVLAALTAGLGAIAKDH